MLSVCRDGTANESVKCWNRVLQVLSSFPAAQTAGSFYFQNALSETEERMTLLTDEDNSKIFTVHFSDQNH